jgi:hypothetical protein
MAWKVVESVKLYPGNASFVAGAPLCGVRRVTVEEEVGECCEKWRGFFVGNDNCRDCSNWLRVAKWGELPTLCGPVTVCPTCGRKL